jgi:hypothetical protein
LVQFPDAAHSVFRSAWIGKTRLVYKESIFFTLTGVHFARKCSWSEPE